MHAYLIVGRSTEEKIEELTKKLKVKIFEYPLTKIKDVRELGSFTKLAIGRPTAILIKDIDTASIEALNAFLKNLEEPQENLFYILTTTSTKNLPATIVSRCQVIRTISEKREVKGDKSADSFLKQSISEKLLFTSKIRKRDEAIEFVENVVFSCHQRLLKTTNQYLKLAKIVKSASQTLNRLRANGNVQLQLTNFVLGLV